MIKRTIPVTLFDNLSTLRGTDKKFQLKGDFMNMIANKIYNVDHAIS